MSAPEGDAEARSTADAVARRSYGKLVAFLAARTRDMAAAEDALAEAFAAALADWRRGAARPTPRRALDVARRKTIDAARRRRSGEAAAAQLQLLAAGLEAAAEPAIPDHRLALMFACAQSGDRGPASARR